jgi:hypothetical protein
MGLEATGRPNRPEYQRRGSFMGRALNTFENRETWQAIGKTTIVIRRVPPIFFVCSGRPSPLNL